MRNMVMAAFAAALFSLSPSAVFAGGAQSKQPPACENPHVQLKNPRCAAVGGHAAQTLPGSGGNTAAVNQTGKHNTIIVDQNAAGGSNAALVTQGGKHNTIIITQTSAK